MTALRRYLPGVVGIALVAIHAALLPVLLGQCRRDSLQVRATAPPAAPSLSVAGCVPADVFDRVHVTVDGEPAHLGHADVGPGIHRVEWSVRYQGGFERRVGLTQLVGPFQEPAQPPCSVRMLVGQQFLDDGNAGVGTVANLARRIAHSEFEGFEQWPIGRFDKVTKMSLRWAKMIHGYLEITVELGFTSGSARIWMALIPRLENGEIQIETVTKAGVYLKRRVYQWIADFFDADDIASATAEKEVQAALLHAFTPPPPIPLPGGRELRFAYCPDQPIEIVDGKYAAIPLAMSLEGASKDILPVTLGVPERSQIVETDAPLAFEFDLDAINAVLYYLWRTEFLDQELQSWGLDRRFNQNSTVRELLSIRIGDIRLSLPPTVSNGDAMPRAFEMGAEATLLIRDGHQKTPARVYSTVGFDFVGGDSAGLVADITLRDLALTCEPEPGLLKPCYSEIVAELSKRSDDLHGELTRLFTRQFNQIILNRNLGTDDMMATFAVERAEVHATKLEPTGIVRVDLFGHLRE